MPVATVREGVYELEVGGPAGTIVSRREGPPEVDAQSRPGQVEQVEDVVDRASDVTTKVERSKALFEDLADGSLEPAQVTNSVDSLVGLLEKLDKEGNHEDALRVARVLSKLLTLARRWADLLEALGTVERLGKLANDGGQALAWAKHELGTVQLVQGDMRASAESLSAAQELREEAGDRAGVEATKHNLGTHCEQMREMLRRRELRPKRRFRDLVRGPAAVVVAIGVLLAAAAAASSVAGGGPLGIGSNDPPAGSTGPSGPRPPFDGGGPLGPVASNTPLPGGPSGPSGASGTSGASGASGSSGASGPSGASGASGSSGASGASGSSGASGTSGPSDPGGSTSPPEYALTAEVEGEGELTSAIFKGGVCAIKCTVKVAEGEEVTLTAKPNGPFKVLFTGACEGVELLDCELTVNEPITAGVVFAP